MIRVCLRHGLPLQWRPDALEHVCTECSLDAAREAYNAATDEATASLGQDLPERIDPFWTNQDPPF